MYLDCVNNVAIVGHANEAVANAICNQSTLLMTNSRYLSQNRQNYKRRHNKIQKNSSQVL